MTTSFRSLSILRLRITAYVMCMFLIFAVSPATADESEELWKAIETASSNVICKFDDKFESSLHNHWLEVEKSVQTSFRRMVESENRRKNLAYFVNQFGNHGSQADMRWLLAEPAETLCHGQGGVVAGLSTDNSERSRKARANQILLAQLQVHAFLKNPKMMKRYYHAVVWYGFQFGVFFGNTVATMQEDFTRKSKNYWWHARNFLMFAHATGRDDLLRDVQPDQLHLHGLEIG